MHYRRRLESRRRSWLEPHAGRPQHILGLRWPKWWHVGHLVLCAALVREDEVLRSSHITRLGKSALWLEQGLHLCR